MKPALQLTLWLAAAIATSYVAVIHGIFPAVCAVAVASLSCFKPTSIIRLPHPTRSWNLLAIHWSFLWSAYLGFVLFEVWFIKAWIQVPFGLLIGLALSLGPVLLMMMAPSLCPSHCQLVFVREGKHIRSCYFKVCVFDTSFTDYLWRPDNVSLLIAQSDEHRWFLYEQTFDSSRRTARFPFNIVIGRYPRIRRVTLKDDWSWLEPLWLDLGLSESDFANAPQRSNLSPLIESHSPSHIEHARDFFINLIPRCRDFPVYEQRAMMSVPKKDRTQFTAAAIVRIRKMIPAQSRFFASLGQWATEQSSQPTA